MKDKIVESASKNIQLYGLKKFTIDEIASDLKISKKTIYKYFKSKDEIIGEYFNEIIETDKVSTIKLIEENEALNEKLYSIIYSYHKYKLPVRILDEAYRFYPEQWKKVQELKNFKIGVINEILKQGINDGIIRSDINFNIVSLILEKVSDTFLDYNFLSDNDMTIKESMKQVMNIMLDGILKKD